MFDQAAFFKYVGWDRNLAVTWLHIDNAFASIRRA